MIDLHTHSLFSDGCLLPSELARRAAVKGVRYLAITDHVDPSNLEFVLPRVKEACREINRHWSIRVLAGVELTHLPPEIIGELAARARQLGAQIIVVHGETLVEPVPSGTNRAALQADVDILAHPGLLTEEEARLARERGILLEISGRSGHCYANGHVAALARKLGAEVILDTDSHTPGDLMDRQQAERILLGAGLGPVEVQRALENGEQLARKSLMR